MTNDIPQPEHVSDNAMTVLSKAKGDLISDKEIKRAAKTAGLVSLTPATIKAFKKIGQFLDLEGIAMIQAGRIMGTSENLAAIADAAREIAENAVDPEVKVEAIKAATAAYGQKINADAILHKMLENKMVGGEQKRRKFQSMPQGPIVAVHTEGSVTIKEGG